MLPAVGEELKSRVQSPAESWVSCLEVSDWFGKTKLSPPAAEVTGYEIPAQNRWCQSPAQRPGAARASARSGRGPASEEPPPLPGFLLGLQDSARTCCCSVITESQNGRGWKGPLWVTQSHPLQKQGHPEQAVEDLIQVGL